MTSELHQDPGPEEGDLGSIVADFSSLGIALHADDFALRVEGNYMDGAGICDGDAVLVSRRRAANYGNIVVALVDGRVTIRRLEKNDAGIDVLRSADPRLLDIHVLDGVRVEGVVVGLVRRL